MKIVQAHRQAGFAFDAMDEEPCSDKIAAGWGLQVGALHAPFPHILKVLLHGCVPAPSCLRAGSGQQWWGTR